MPRNRDDFSSTELVETQLVPQVGLSSRRVDGCRRRKVSTNGLLKSCAKQVKAYRLQRVAAGTAVCGIGVQIRESPGAARQRAERVVVVCGPWCRGSVSADCRTKLNSARKQSGLMVGVAQDVL
jgi:hypothetical protein